MRADNPEGWQAIVEAADMRRGEPRDYRCMSEGRRQGQGTGQMHSQDSEPGIRTVLHGANA